MSGKSYVGINNIAREIKKIYVGDSNSIARQVKNGYVGVNNIAKNIYGNGPIKDNMSIVIRPSAQGEYTIDYYTHNLYSNLPYTFYYNKDTDTYSLSPPSYTYFIQLTGNGYGGGVTINRVYVSDTKNIGNTTRPFRLQAIITPYFGRKGQETKYSTINYSLTFDGSEFTTTCNPNNVSLGTQFAANGETVAAYATVTITSFQWN